jgi:putative transposase
MHYGTAGALHAQRAQTLELAYTAQPLRFKGRVPKPPALPTAARINPPKKETATNETINTCSQISNDRVSQND